MSITRIIIYSFFLFTIVGCIDDENFSLSPSHHLTYSADTISFDTLFSNVPSATKSFWIFNKTKDNLRVSSVTLSNGSLSGFRVNVNGVYLGSSNNYSTKDIEILKGDSIRIYAEVTPSLQNKVNPTLVDDSIIVKLENGNQHKIILNCYAWDALVWRNKHISRDSIVQTNKPIVVYGGLTIDSAATVTLAAGTSIYFHQDAALNVYGTLLSKGSSAQWVVLRGDRTDRMFPYLPYDRIAGQWQGVHFYPSSKANKMQYTDVHSAFTGILMDSTQIASTPNLEMQQCTVHNSQGIGCDFNYNYVILQNSQITNSQDFCLSLNHGKYDVNQCTIAQFYPFEGRKSTALGLLLPNKEDSLNCRNSIVTSYDNEAITLYKDDSLKINRFTFSNSYLRQDTSKLADAWRYVQCISEMRSDTGTVYTKMFKKIDTDSLQYNFKIVKGARIIDQASVKSALPIDHDGRQRDDKPDMGAYEYIKEQ